MKDHPPLWFLLLLIPLSPSIGAAAPPSTHLSTHPAASLSFSRMLSAGDETLSLTCQKDATHCQVARSGKDASETGAPAEVPWADAEKTIQTFAKSATPGKRAAKVNPNQRLRWKLSFDGKQVEGGALLTPQDPLPDHVSIAEARLSAWVGR